MVLYKPTMSKNVGGRPRKSYEMGALEFGAGAEKIKVRMADRKDVEAICERQIEELQNDFSEMKSDAKVLVTCLRSQIEAESAETGRVDKTLLENFEKAQNRVRHICKDQSSILAMLMKQFELFSALDRPKEDDPIYTPVEILIDGDAPEEALVEPQFRLEDSDVEPARR